MSVMTVVAAAGLRFNVDELTSNLYNLIRNDDKPRVMEHWHASSIAKCPKEQYLMRKGALPIAEPGAGKILRWKAGHIIEGVIRPYLKELYPNLESNFRMTNKELDLTGEYDNYDADSKTLIEIKSVSGHAVRYRRKEETRHHLRDDGPYLHHEWQQHAYVILLKELGIPVERIIYLYITLDGLLVPYETPVNPLILEQVEETVRELNIAWAMQEAPDCVCGDEDDPLYKGSFQWCQFKTDYNCCEAPIPAVVK